MLAGGVVGSFFGLILGLASLNRPLLNGFVFYLLGFVVGGLAGAVAGLLLRGLRALRRSRAGPDGASP